MYFYRKNGKQCLDLQGNFILTRNKRLIRALGKSIAPDKVLNASYAEDVTNMNFRGKIWATCLAIGFIWGGRT